MDLPSGQAVCHGLGEEPISDEKLTVGTPKGDTYLTKISNEFCENAPLWYYILAEAENLYEGEKLGPVGGRIVMETFVGLLMEDGHSYLRQQPLWKPKFDDPEKKFGIAELIRIAIHQ